jgi:hypothetical protein
MNSMNQGVTMLRTINPKRILVLLGLLVAATGAGQAQAQTAGIIQFAAGAVTLTPANGQARAARKGVAVSVGDTVATAAGGMAQVKMGDGAIIVVQPESQLTVAEFHYVGREDGSEKVRYRLDQGGFRAITGAIGRTHKKNYVIETPVAHMGVRGTDHESYYFPAGGPIAQGAKPGAYNKVNTGRTFIRSAAGEVEVAPNEVGYVASATEVPMILSGVPGFFNRSVEPRSGRSSAQPSQAAGAPLTVEVGDRIVTSADDQMLVKGRGSKMEGGTGTGPLVGYVLEQGVGFGKSGRGMDVMPNGAPLMQMGSDDAWGVKWGTWEGGLATVGGKQTLGAVQMIQSTQLTSATQLGALPASLVTANFAYAGGPAPTNSLGQQGSINALDVSVNFSTQMVTNYSVQASVQGDWSANGSGSIANFTGAAGIALRGNCSGCTPGTGSPAAQGTAHGAFVGSQAEKMITTFGLSSAGKSIAGAAYLSR